MAQDIVTRETYVSGDGSEIPGNTLLGRLYTTVKGAENQLARDTAWLAGADCIGRVVSLRDSQDNRWFAVVVIPVEPEPANRITFDVERGDDGSRELFIAGTGTLVGWIEQGRAMASVVDGRDRLWTEWGFTPARETERSHRVPVVHDSISKAYDEARVYAAALVWTPPTT